MSQFKSQSEAGLAILNFLRDLIPHAEEKDFEPIRDRLSLVKSLVNMPDAECRLLFITDLISEGHVSVLISFLGKGSFFGDSIIEEVTWILIGVFSADIDLINAVYDQKIVESLIFCLSSQNMHIIDNVFLTDSLGVVKSRNKERCRQRRHGQDECVADHR